MQQPQNNNNSRESRDLESMRNTLIDIEQRLRAQRKMSVRPADLDEMTGDQLMEEKLELQSCLMHFEHLFGSNHVTSTSSEVTEAAEEAEKALVKNLYDRYRKVKRLVRRSSAKSEQQLELETIPEDEAIPLTLASPQYRINIELTKIDAKQEAASSTNANAEAFVGSKGDVVGEDDNSVGASCGDDEDDEVASNGNNESSVEEGLHSLSRYELLEILRRTREEKRRLRKTVKEMEAAASSSTTSIAASKMKAAGDEVGKFHQLYKRSKAKIKLIDALLSKKVEHFY